MKMYHWDWVAWHRELAKKIAEGGRDDLVEKIGQVADKVPEQKSDLAKLGKDPLSFFSFLRESQSESNKVCEAVQDVFELPKLHAPKLRDIIFPPVSESLSRQSAMLSSVEDDDLLWRLFEQATQATEDNPDIRQEDWKVAMGIDGVEVGKLTQALFLVNPDIFLPMDSAVDACFPEGWRKEKEEKIKGDKGYAEYSSAQKEIEELFPGCEPYEIYTFLRWQEDKGAVSKDSKFFQISTNAHGDKNEDFWDKEGLEETWGWGKKDAKDINFKENNWVFVGGPGGGTNMGWGDVEKENLSWGDIKNKKPRGRFYPVCDDPERRDKVPPKRGDIILVRTEITKGRAIGIVLENDYNKPDGLKYKSKIHVLWINKSESSLAKSTLRRLAGFSYVNQERRMIYGLFANEKAYQPSFELINPLTEKTIENEKQINQDRQQAVANTVKDPYFHPLNMILYGPPGTGKTYDTVNYAVAIIEGKRVEAVKKERGEEDKGKSHKGVKERFDEYCKSKQIEMVTFHQNYAYEDFIEGIRPVLDEDIGDDVKYELREGVFREISDRATKNMEKSGRVAKSVGKAESISETWDIDELLQAFAESVQEKIEAGEKFKLFSEDDKSEATITKVFWKKDGMFRSFQLGGSVTSDQSLSKKVIERDYKAFYDGEIKSAKDIKPTRKSDRPQYGHARYYFLLFKRMREFQANWKLEPRSLEEEGGVKKYVLIIDEINRGNIAKIFGELITLIEESRRLGETEATEVTLPYSGESFGVPNNLYIIGTMNTADRSIALLDTALRRRFEFKEMMPDPSQIERDIEGVNLRKLLEKMNERIRVLLDREHQIGHTYFFVVKDMNSLKKAFQNRIIPLLQEYFYDNYEKINLVLNKNGFIEKKEIPNELVGSDLIDEDRGVHELLSFDDEKWKESGRYRKIYMESNEEQNTEQNTEQNESGNG